MYEIMKFVVTGAIAGMGLMMFLSPEKSTKAENRDKPEEVAKIKRNGLIITIIGLIALAVCFFI